MLPWHFNGDDGSLIERQLFRSDSNGRTMWIADAHRDDGKRFVVRADEKLTAFLELESVIFQGNAVPKKPAAEC